MVRGLAQHINETDISDDIHSYGLVAKDIRLIRKKETGIASMLGPSAKLCAVHQRSMFLYFPQMINCDTIGPSKHQALCKATTTADADDGGDEVVSIFKRNGKC